MAKCLITLKSNCLWLGLRAFYYFVSPKHARKSPVRTVEDTEDRCVFPERVQMSRKTKKFVEYSWFDVEITNCKAYNSI